MPVYFFHIRHDAGLIEDEEGRELPDLPAARREALQSAMELRTARDRATLPRDLKAIEIADEYGEVLLSVPFSDLPSH